jgi:hypothetical protein
MVPDRPTHADVQRSVLAYRTSRKFSNRYLPDSLRRTSASGYKTNGMLTESNFRLAHHLVAYMTVTNTRGCEISSHIPQ